MARTDAALRTRAHRMNKILNMLLHETVTLKEVTGELGVNKNTALLYLNMLIDFGKIVVTEPQEDRRFKHYRLVPGALPVPVPADLRPPKPEPKKRGRKPGPQKNCFQGIAAQTVKVVAAVQVGAQRDPLIAALFGGAPC